MGINSRLRLLKFAAISPTIFKGLGKSLGALETAVWLSVGATILSSLGRQLSQREMLSKSDFFKNNEIHGDFFTKA